MLLPTKPVLFGLQISGLIPPRDERFNSAGCRGKPVRRAADQDPGWRRAAASSKKRKTSFRLICTIIRCSTSGYSL